jgi:hypothetical protein
MMEADVTVESALGEGFTCTIRLPTEVTVLKATTPPAI